MLCDALCVCSLHLLVEMKAGPDLVFIGQMKKRPAPDTEGQCGAVELQKTSQLGQKPDLDRFSVVA